MTLVIDSFKDWPRNNENDIGVVEWFRKMLKNAKCLVCGELVLNRKQFIWWRADSDIVLCSDCAEHTLNGLNRDLAELKGDKSAKKQTGDKYSPILLKKEIDRLQGQILIYLRRIVEFQNMLSRPD